MMMWQVKLFLSFTEQYMYYYKLHEATITYQQYVGEVL